MPGASAAGPCADGTQAAPADAPVIEVREIVTRFGTQTVHDGVSFAIDRGTLVALIGGSGTGKSVLLREIIGLQRPTSGRIALLGTDIGTAGAAALAAVRRRFGVTFQDGALFSSLTVAQNVAVPLREHTSLAPATVDALVAMRLRQAGLPPEAGAKLPSELSGGMRKRAAIARAIALEPEVLFLDEPTSGLDPIGVRQLRDTIGRLNEDLGMTVFMNTHLLSEVARVCTTIGVLDHGELIYKDSIAETLRRFPDERSLEDIYVRMDGRSS